MKLKLQYRKRCLEDLAYWQQVDKKKLERVNKLIQAIRENPYDGIGKPEALKHEFLGCWSRRINKEHRLIYMVQDDAIILISARFHYSDR